jgi:hypothetical protein
LEEANAERAWAAVGGLIAFIGATCAVFLAVVLVLPGSLVEKSLSIVAAVGSIIGTASLLFFAWPANPDSSIRPYAYKGLWIGWLLQTKALIMIIFANVLLDKNIITSETFTALLLMAIGSTMLTVPVVSPMLRRMKALLARSA